MWRARANGDPAPPSSSFFSPALRRALAMLLLPFSMVPVAVLAPSLVRAPGVLVQRAERVLASAQVGGPPMHRAPSEPLRYPPGASRLERDVFAPVAGPLTPQVGVSPLAEHQTLAEAAHAPLLLVTGEPRGGAR
jgi:hypothetical protein